MVKNKIYKIVILGPPASGKGTQATFLAERLNIPSISVGQILRDEVEKESECGKMVKDQMKSGGLVSNAIVNKLVRKRLEQPDCQRGFVFDGFPRIMIQAKYLDTLIKITHVLEIAVSDQEVINRLSGRRTCPRCGRVYHLKFNPPKKDELCDDCQVKLEIREDDTEQAIRRRLKIYHQETEEVVGYYREKGLLIRINGEQSIEDVRAEIFNKLNLN